MQTGSPYALPLAPQRLLSTIAGLTPLTRRNVLLPGTGHSRRPFTRPQRPPLTRLPFRGQSSRPATSRPREPAPLPVRLSAQLPQPVRPDHGSFVAFNPLQLHWPAVLSAVPASTPLREHYLPRDQSVPPRRLSAGPPSEIARSPVTPRSHNLLLVSATDHRSRSASSSEAC